MSRPLGPYFQVFYLTSGMIFLKITVQIDIVTTMSGVKGKIQK